MSLTLAQAVTVAILAFSTFFCGWFLQRLKAKSREAELQRVVLETKGFIPQLEATVRNREQRLAALAAEIDDGKSRIAALESGLRDRDKEVSARDRALRSLNSEISVLRETAAQASAAPPAQDDHAVVALRDRLAAAERRNAELEARLANGSALPAPSAASDVAGAAPQPIGAEHLARIDALTADLAARDRAVADLEGRLRSESVHAGTLGATVESLEAQLVEAREEIAKWRARVPKLAESLKEREDRLAESTGRVGALEEKSVATARRAEALEAALTATKTALANAESSLHAANRAQSAAEDRAIALEREHRELANRTSAAEAALAERTRRLAERESEIAAMAAAAEESRNEFSKKLATSIRLGREEIDRLGHDLGAEIERLTRDLGDAITRRNDAAEEIAALRTEMAARQALVDSAREKEAAFESEKRALAERVDALAREKEEALAARRTAEEGRAALAADVAARDGRIRDLEAAAARVQQDRSALEAEAARALEHRRGLEAECAALAERSDTLSGELDTTLARLAAAEAANRDAAEEAAGAARAAAAAKVASLEEEIRQWQARLVPIEELARQRETALAERGARIDALKDQIGALEARLTERRESAPRAEAANAMEKIDYLEQRVAAQFDRNRELAAALEARDRTIADLHRDQSLKDKSLGVLQQQLEHVNAANERLAAELRELREREDADRGPAAAGPPPQRPQRLHATRPDRVDDLKAIRGIGAAFEARLNELGIFQFDQIAALTEPEVVWLENELKMFRGRIGRDGWIAQALECLAATPWHAGSGRAEPATRFASP